ncbi:protein STRUBBELIG isoform X2 [Brachypodium distachyon]|nr:protein STRUBBELIG isoform X2 [Brachypodium distachyon]|eukprot:XP_024316376.1 protein STRUBBELIG isoform X2 [Brachypodium distachyon]
MCIYDGLGCVACYSSSSFAAIVRPSSFPSMETMRGTIAPAGILLCLTFCSVLEHSCSQMFPFPIPFFGPSYTNQQDVDAVNELYVSLGLPDLRGWSASGGDPCEERWQGVQCVGPNITAIELRGTGLEGKLSDALGKLNAITRLDISSNNLTGKLPDTMAKLGSLSTLHVQNNRLTGTLDVLGDLPLKDLNVENNLFSGPIPEKLLTIPKFLKNGNHFTLPGSSPSSSSSTSPPSAAQPHINVIPAVTSQGTADSGGPRHGKKVSPAKAAGFSVLAAGSLTFAVLVTMFTVSKQRQERSTHGGYLRRIVMNTPSWPPMLDAAANLEKEHCTVTAEEEIVGPSAHPPVKNSSMSTIVADNTVQGSSEEDSQSDLQFPFRFFTLASLQQCTDSFGHENLMRETRLGKVYIADHPESKLAVLKLRDTAAEMATDEFLENVQTIAGLEHPNVEELVGCCVEHGQRLLVYKHFSDHTLDDMIHGDSFKFPWHARIAVALDAAKALEHLHGCGGGGGWDSQAAVVVHGSFRPEHVLISGSESEARRVRVSGCGLTPFAPPPPSGTGDSELWRDDDDGGGGDRPVRAAMGDVYDFGAVMLELLTGRRRHEGARRPQGERDLVPWAAARLHDLSALRRMADPRLFLGHGGGASMSVPAVRSLSRFADIVSRCVQREAEFRPAMAEVVQDLRRAMEEAAAVES